MNKKTIEPIKEDVTTNDINDTYYDNKQDKSLEVIKIGCTWMTFIITIIIIVIISISVIFK